MSEEMKNHYGKNTQWLLSEAVGTINELKEGDQIPQDFEVYGEGDSFCMVDTVKLIESASSEIDTLTEQVRQLREERDSMIDVIEKEAINSVSVMFKPHIAGVFAVIRSKLLKAAK